MAKPRTYTDVKQLIGRRLRHAFDLEQRAEGVSDESRTIRLAITSDTPIYHGFGYLVLDHSPESIVLDRVRAAAAPLLENHDRALRLGRLSAPETDGHVLRLDARFSRRPYAEEIFGEVKDDLAAGQPTPTSGGFVVYEVDDKPESVIDGLPVYRSRRWELFEGSVVSIAADIIVGFDRSMDDDDEAAEEDERERRSEVCKECEGASCDVCNPPGERQQESSAEERTNNQTIEVITTMDKMKEFEELGRFLGMEQMAREYFAGGKTIEEFQRDAHAKLVDESARNLVSADVDLSKKERRQYSIARAILQFSEGTFDGLEREVHDELEKQLPENYKRRGGVLVATRYGGRKVEERAGLDSGTSTKGAEVKFVEPGEFIDLLRNAMKVAALGARMLSGLRGPVTFPRQTGAATAVWVGENSGSDVSESNATLGTKTLSPKTLQGTTSFSRQLLAQAVIDTENFVRTDLAQVHALSIDAAAIAGTGSSNQPTGILNTSGVSLVAIGTNGGNPTYDHMVDLETAIGEANGLIGDPAYLTTPGIKGRLKKTQEFSSSNGLAVWRGGEVNGYRAEASQQVPSTLTKGTSSGNCHAAILGIWEQLLVGEWGALELIVDPFRLKKQGMIEVTSFQMVDILARIAECFAVIKDALK